jgi:predicted Zn finger-like uncharacterized protein
MAFSTRKRTPVARRATIHRWMKITCQACAAKYTIADEKVLGKIVKIRCKKCGATIIVNGNDPTASAGAAGSEPPHAHDPAFPAAQGGAWTVNVADGDQRSMSDGEIADAYRAGVVGDETFCWMDGMADWLPIREIAPLHAVCNATGAPAGAARPIAPPSDEDDDATKIQETVPAAFQGRFPPAAGRPATGLAGNGAPLSTAAPSAAARRAGGRAPAADLFSGAARAGGEEDVLTSAPVGMPRVHDDSAKLTGQRNENSVLFSLNALTSKGPSPSARPLTATTEASGLIDIRQLSAQIGIGQDSKKRSRVDDIMNLSGGGAFSASLSAPVLSAPAIEEYAPPPSAAPPGHASATGGKSRAIIFGAIGAGVLVVAGAIGVAVMVMGKTDTGDKDQAAASAASSAGPLPTAPAAIAALSATASNATAAGATAPTDTSAATSATAASPSVAAAKTAPTIAPPIVPPAGAPKVATTTSPAPAVPAPTPPPAAGGADQPFNMGEAKARLAGIAGSVQACKKGDLSGSGRVVVTFAPGGNVASAVVSGPPFEGTATGACVASRFRGARVPAFAGSPFSVSKSFTIN